MAHLDIRTLQLAQRLRQRFIECACALAAAQHQQAQPGIAAGEAFPRRCDAGDHTAHGIAHHDFLARKSIRKTGQHAAREGGQHAVGHARRAILLMHQQRNAGDDRGDAARARREATEAHHRAGTVPAQHFGGRTDGGQHPQRCAQQRTDALAAQTGDGDGVDGDIVLRHQPRLHAAVRAQPHHRDSARAQRSRDRKARENMSTRTAGEDHHRRSDRACRHLGSSSAHARLPNVGSTRSRRRLVPRRVVIRAGAPVCTGGGAFAGVLLDCGPFESTALEGTPLEGMPLE